jgi:hypothetical protein
MDHLMMEHLIRCVVEIVNLMRHQQDVEKMDVQQIPDEQNRDVVLTFLDAVHRFLVNLVNLADVQVVVEPRHLLKMDYYQDEVLALVLLQQVLQVLQVHSHPESVALEQAQLLQLLLLHEMLSRHQDLHRVLLPILRQVRDQPQHSFWQRSFSQLPS